MTLLELILALALAGLLLMAISMALHMHWKAFDVRRTNVERALLVRSIQRHIADDLRSTIKFEPPDLSGLEAVAGIAASPGTSDSGDGGGDSGSGNSSGGSSTGGSTGNTGGGSGGSGGNAGAPARGSSGSQQPGGNNQSGAAGSGALQQPAGSGGVPGFGSTGAKTGSSSSGNAAGSATGGGSAGSGNSSTGSGSTGGSTGSQGTGSQSGAEAATQSGPSVVVGLYGTATELQFDISRLPRVDQYQALSTSDASVVEIPSDIKTVTYFLRSEDSAAAADSILGATSIEPSTTGTGRGLMRAESDRAVTAWSELNGTTQSHYSSAKLLAEEVTAVQFQYFDGSQWVSEWNSDEMGGLPVAIEVLLNIAEPQSPSARDASFVPLGADAPPSQERTYRMVVHLPVGGVESKTSETTESSESMDSAGSSGSTNTGGSGGTGTGSTTGGTAGGTMP